MNEILAAVSAGLLWVGAFVLLVLGVRARAARSLGSAVLAAFPLFFALQVILANALDAAGLLTGPAVRLFYGVAAAVGLVLCLRGEWWRIPAPMAPAPEVADRRIPRISRVVLATVAGTIVALAVFTLVVPVHVWDSLAYHLPMVASYVQNGSLEPWATQDLRQIYRVNAGELQMLNLALLAGSDAWVELPNLLGLVVMLTATFEVARLAFARETIAYVAVILVLTAPQIVVGAASSKNDIVFTAALLSSFYWMIRAGMADGRRARAHVLLAALSGGLAGATKVMGLNVVGAVGLLALGMSIRRIVRVRHLLLFAGGAAAALLLLAGNVYLFNMGRSAVPVGVAPGEVNFTIGMANVIEAGRFYLFDLTLKRLVTIPVFEHDFLHYGYLFPAMLVLGVVAAFRQFRERRFVLIAVAVMGGALFLSVIAVRLPVRWDQRFMIWLVPTLAVLSLSMVESLRPRRLLIVTWIAVSLAAINVGLLLTIEYDRLFPRSALHLASTGSLPRYLDVPNHRYLHMNEGLEHLDRAATSGDAVLYVGTDDSWMYPLWGPRFTRRVEGVWDASHAAALTRSGRFDFVVIEAESDPAIRASAEAAARESGYCVLVEGPNRSVFARDRVDGAHQRGQRAVACRGSDPPLTSAPD